MHPELSHVLPLKLFFIFNKAIRGQLGDLHRWATTRVNISQNVDSVDRSMADQYRFLGLLYMHDLNAKNEVIYSALDERMKNNSVQNYINIQRKWEDDSFEIGCQREFVSSVESLKQLVSQNMAKEEVLTLLLQHFNLKEQAHLVWQYLRSFPVYVLSKLLPWLSSSLLPREYRDLLDCLGTVIPNEALLQQAIFNMIERNGDCTLNMERVKCETQRAASHPIDDILLWHNAIRNELNETFEMVKRSGDFTSGSAFDEKLKFIAEICIFHSIAKDTVVFPAVYGEAFSFRQRNEEEIKFNELRLLLQTAREASHNYSRELYSKLCSCCDEITGTINRHLYIEESEVLTHTREMFNVEKQREILYQSLLVMPLRLIERVLPWLAGMMDADEVERFLHNIQLAAPASETGLILLFHSWASKSSSERSFGFDKETSPQPTNLDFIPSKNFTIGQNFLFPALETKGTNLNISHVISVGCADHPIDVVFEFHKAIRRDLEYLSVESGKIGDGDEAFLRRFTERFLLFRGLHKAHCSFEDNIIYPALDSRKSVQDFTRSYSLDHQCEETMFEEISRALEIRKTADSTVDLSAKIQMMCNSIRMRVDQHMFREEHELWPLLRSRFSEEEQNKMVGFVLGTTGANALRLLLPWLTSALSQDERKKTMDTLKHVTKNTMFGDWLGECSKGNPAATSQNFTSVSFDGKRRKNLLRRYMTSHWMSSQPSLPQLSENVFGRSPSYRDLEEKVFGCEHFKRNCKLRATCCGDLFTCNKCHDSACNHSMDRKATTEMMCMQCLVVQPVGLICTTPSCNGYPMAKYACEICKVFDDERNIYHCPFCNVCRVGKGLGVDYFHCMSCNCCMSVKLVDHTCKPNCLEASCPVCDEFMFTSTKPVQALPCGHFIHSECFKGCKSSPDYSCLICSGPSGKKTNEKPETKISVYNHIEEEDTEISSWAAHSYQKKVFGFLVDRLCPSLKGKDKDKESVLVCGFVLCSLVVFLVMATLVVLLCLKLLTPNDYVFSR